MVGVCISLTFWGEMDIMRSSYFSSFIHKCPNGLGGQLETSVHNHIDVIRRPRVSPHMRVSHIIVQGQLTQRTSKIGRQNG